MRLRQSTPVAFLPAVRCAFHRRKLNVELKNEIADLSMQVAAAVSAPHLNDWVAVQSSVHMKSHLSACISS